MQSKSCVYWIHTAEQTDIFTQGYVGVSVTGATKRFRIHKSDTKAGSNLPVHNAIRKYGDSIIIDVVLTGPPEYCYLMEGKLRPLPNIGYNVSAGGTSTNLGSKHTNETKKKISVAGKGRVCSESTRELHRVNSTGRLHTEETKENLRTLAKKRGVHPNTRKGRIALAQSLPPWGNSFANHDVWLRAVELYNYVQLNPNDGIRKIGKTLNILWSQLQVIHKKIKSGWNPSLDADWLIFSSKLTPDTSGDKSLNPADADK